MRLSPTIATGGVLSAWSTGSVNLGVVPFFSESSGSISAGLVGLVVVPFLLESANSISAGLVDLVVVPFLSESANSISAGLVDLGVVPFFSESPGSGSAGLGVVVFLSGFAGAISVGVLAALASSDSVVVGNGGSSSETNKIVLNASGNKRKFIFYVVHSKASCSYQWYHKYSLHQKRNDLFYLHRCSHIITIFRPLLKKRTTLNVLL